MKVVLDNQRAVCIANLHDWGVVYIVVNGSGNVRVGDNEFFLKADNNDGIPFNSTTPATTPIWWKGALFAIADVQTNISVIVAGYGMFAPGAK